MTSALAVVHFALVGQSCEQLPGFGILPAVYWVAVKELKLSYHNGYI